MDTLTHTSATTYHGCARKYYWRYERWLCRKRAEDSEALAVGDAGHIGREVFNKTGSVEKACEAIGEWEDAQPAIGRDLAKRTQRACKARACVRVAAEEWPLQDRLPERIVEMPIRNPETGRRSRTFRFKGKLDGLCDSMVVDYKFVGDPSRFINRQALSWQMELYALACGVSLIHGTEYRLVRTPTIKLKQASRNRKCDQSPQEYEGECYDWIRKQRGGVQVWPKYAAADRLEVAAHWLWETARDIAENRKSGRWFCNPSACYQWERECPFMPLCLALQNGDDWLAIAEIDYEQREPHPELLKAD